LMKLPPIHLSPTSSSAANRWPRVGSPRVNPWPDSVGPGRG
jgi:hypothetical protein